MSWPRAGEKHGAGSTFAVFAWTGSTRFQASVGALRDHRPVPGRRGAGALVDRCRRRPTHGGWTSDRHADQRSSRRARDWMHMGMHRASFAQGGFAQHGAVAGGVHLVEDAGRAGDAALDDRLRDAGEVDAGRLACGLACLKGQPQAREGDALRRSRGNAGWHREKSTLAPVYRIPFPATASSRSSACRWSRRRWGRGR